MIHELHHPRRERHMPTRRHEAVVVGEPQRAFYGAQFSDTFPVFVHFGVELWVPSDSTSTTTPSPQSSATSAQSATTDTSSKPPANRKATSLPPSMSRSQHRTPTTAPNDSKRSSKRRCHVVHSNSDHAIRFWVVDCRGLRSCHRSKRSNPPFLSFDLSRTHEWRGPTGRLPSRAGRCAGRIAKVLLACMALQDRAIEISDWLAGDRISALD